MSFIVKLYDTSSPSNKINKELTFKSELAVNLKNRPKDLNNLDIDLSMYTFQATRYNYAVIPSLNLYYFVKIQPSNIGNSHNIMHLELDPLMTYKSQILSLNVITKRNTNNYNVYLNDENQKITEQTKQFYHTFKGGDISYFKPHKSILLTLVGSS